MMLIRKKEGFSVGERDAGLARQIRALAPFALGNAWRGRWSSATIVVCVMLVIVILSAFLAMAQGFASTANSAGSDRIVVFLGQQSQSEANSQVTRDQLELIADAPGLVRRRGVALLSPELTMTVSGHRREDKVKVNTTLRGLTPAGFELRDGFHLVDGRLPTPGHYEVIVGRRLAQSTASTGTGDVTTLANRRWTVVGRYALGSDVFESEYLADLGAVQSAYDRENQLQSVRAELANPAALALVRDYLARDPRLKLDAKTERQLYADQVKDTTAIILYLGWPLAGILAVGSLAGVLNTMLIVLEGRRHSLRVIRMLGFSSVAIVASVVMETVLLAVIGALLGIGLVFLATRGLQATVIGGNFTTITYNLRVDGTALLRSLALAAALGAIGGAVPSLSLSKRAKVGR